MNSPLHHLLNNPSFLGQDRPRVNSALLLVRAASEAVGKPKSLAGKAAGRFWALPLEIGSVLRGFLAPGTIDVEHTRALTGREKAEIKAQLEKLL